MLLQASRIKIQQESTYSQTLRYGQYLTHAHSHIPTVAVNIWSCPCLHVSHYRGDMAVRMPKILTTPQSAVAYASLLNLGLAIDCMC